MPRNCGWSSAHAKSVDKKIKSDLLFEIRKLEQANAYRPSPIVPTPPPPSKQPRPSRRLKCPKHLPPIFRLKFDFRIDF